MTGEEDFAAFYAATADRLVGRLYLVVRDLEEARDCVQEAYARAWLRWSTLQDDPAGWVYTVAWREGVSRHRRRRTHDQVLHRLGLPSAAPGPEVETLAVRDALARVPVDQRAALVLHYLEDRDVTEVARILGLTESGAKSRLVRGRRALAALLGEDVEQTAGDAVGRGGR